jgi:hypothetical protein
MFEHIHCRRLHEDMMHVFGNPCPKISDIRQDDQEAGFVENHRKLSEDLPLLNYNRQDSLGSM